MGRWEPGSRGRLELAAYELYTAHGFDRTTVAEIAARAGVTERTFYRHFADKREMLFAGAGVLQDQLVEAVAGAPADAPPIAAVRSALDAAGASFDGRRAFARVRHGIIAGSEELQERELIKLANLGRALAGALHGRGVPEPTATLVAQVGVAVFHVSFTGWVVDDDGANLTERMHAALDDLAAVAAGT